MKAFEAPESGTARVSTSRATKSKTLRGGRSATVAVYRAVRASMSGLGISCDHHTLLSSNSFMIQAVRLRAHTQHNHRLPGFRVKKLLSKSGPSRSLPPKGETQRAHVTPCLVPHVVGLCRVTRH